MKRTIKELQRRLEKKREQYNCQLIRQMQLDSTIQNTEKDIQQLEYTLHKLEDIQHGHHKRQTISNKNVTDFFTHISQVFDHLQHLLHRTFNYRMTCALIYARYRFSNRIHSPGQQYLSFETVLTYFKRERAMI